MPMARRNEKKRLSIVTFVLAVEAAYFFVMRTASNAQQLCLVLRLPLYNAEIAQLCLVLRLCRAQHSFVLFLCSEPLPSVLLVQSSELLRVPLEHCVKFVLNVEATFSM